MIYIYDKPFNEVFAAIPWPYKIVVVAGSLFIMLTIFYVGYNSLFGKGPISLEEKPGAITFSSQQAGGQLDPSIAYNPAATSAVLAYTAMTQDANRQTILSTSIATATPPCKNWRFIKNVFFSKEEKLTAPDGESELASGIARYETPTVVYDPDDKGREWKIFAYRYFWNGNVNLAKRYSTIAFKYASDPAGEWSREEWILSAAPDFPPPPYQQLVGVHINALSPELAAYTSYGRPSVVHDRGALLMTLSAFKDDIRPDSIILLGSMDHGKTWIYLGTPLRQEDAALLGAYTSLAGASLLRDDSGVYLAAVLGDDKDGALGTFILPFDKPAKGILKRDDKGAPVLQKHIPRQSVNPSPMGGGFAAYDGACQQGILTSEFSGTQNTWRIFKTLQPITE